MGRAWKVVIHGVLLALLLLLFIIYCQVLIDEGMLGRDLHYIWRHDVTFVVNVLRLGVFQEATENHPTSKAIHSVIYNKGTCFKTFHDPIHTEEKEDG